MRSTGTKKLIKIQMHRLYKTDKDYKWIGFKNRELISYYKLLLLDQFILITGLSVQKTSPLTS